MGERSFYGLKSSYERSMRLHQGMALKAMEYLYPEDKRNYQRALIHRYKLLLEYFAEYSQEHPTDERRKYFLVEVKDMIPELMAKQVPDEIIWKPLEELHQKNDKILLHMIEEGLSSGRRLLEERKQELWLYKRWFGVLSTGAILRISLLTIATVALGLSVFRYLSL
jgi:hypothetical protein